SSQVQSQQRRYSPVVLKVQAELFRFEDSVVRVPGRLGRPQLHGTGSLEPVRILRAIRENDRRIIKERELSILGALDARTKQRVPHVVATNPDGVRARLNAEFVLDLEVLDVIILAATAPNDDRWKHQVVLSRR